VVVVAGLVMTAVLSGLTRTVLADRQRKDLDAEFVRRSDVALAAVDQQVAQYQRGLGVIAAFAGSVPDISPEAWDSFVNSTGILGASARSAVGYVEAVRPAELPSFVASRTAQLGSVPLIVLDPWHVGDTAPFYLMTQLTVSTSDHVDAVAYLDGGALPVFGEAMGRAMSTRSLQTLPADVVITQMREAVDRVRGSALPVGLMDMFVSRFSSIIGPDGASLLVPAIRTTDGSIAGVVIASVLPDTQMVRIEQSLNSELAVNLRADLGDGAVRTYYGSADASSSARRRSIERTIGSTRWTMEAVSTSRFDERSDRSTPATVAGLVGLVGLLVIALVLVRNRMAHKAGRALERLAGAEDRAERDPLTGLLNRIGLETAVAALAPPDDGPAAVVFVDLDGLKRVNDQRGHRAGDELIRLAASRLSDAVRGADIVARYGGDEFVVVVPGVATAATADRIAASIHAALSDPILALDLRLGDPIAASIGVAYAPSPRDVHDAIGQADNAMYRAKAAGGNQVAFADRYPDGPGSTSSDDNSARALRS
jgi:diguanylate cyclase (GGDEF)-like protein